MKEKTIPPFVGIRVKSFTNELIERSIRTLDLFITNLAKETQGNLPENFVVTLPKITHVSQVEALVTAFEKLEDKLSLPTGSLKMEFMVEDTRTLFDMDGRMAMPAMLAKKEGVAELILVLMILPHQLMLLLIIST